MGPGSRSRSSTLNSPFPHADAAQLLGDRSGEDGRHLLPCGAKRVGQPSPPLLRRDQCRGRGRRRIEAALERRQLLAGGRRTGEKVVVVRSAEPAAGVGDPLELSLHVLEPVRLGLERGEEAAEVGAHLAQAQPELPQLLAGGPELRRQALERCECALRAGGEAGRSLAVVRRDRLDRACCTVGELGHVPQPLALVAQRLLAFGLERLRRLHERA